MSNEEVLVQVEKDFSERAQWRSFLELINYKNFIVNSWLGVLKTKLNTCFAVENVVEKWSYISKNIYDYRWFITEYGQESLCLLFNSVSLHLWANREYFDLKKISSLLQEKRYLPIISSFDRHDEIKGEDDEYKIIEIGNFSFDSTDSNDRHYYNNDQIAWYAKFKTEEFVQQIKNKVNKFRMDSNITDLLIEINEKCKIIK